LVTLNIDNLVTEKLTTELHRCFGCVTGGILVEEKLVSLNVKMPKTLKDLMRKYVDMDAHKDLSELTRDAIREKIQKDAPELYKQLFQEAIASE